MSQERHHQVQDMSYVTWTKSSPSFEAELVDDDGPQLEVPTEEELAKLPRVFDELPHKCSLIWSNPCLHIHRMLGQFVSHANSRL